MKRRQHARSCSGCRRRPQTSLQRPRTCRRSCAGSRRRGRRPRRHSSNKERRWRLLALRNSNSSRFMPGQCEGSQEGRRSHLSVDMHVLTLIREQAVPFDPTSFPVGGVFSIRGSLHVQLATIEPWPDAGGGGGPTAREPAIGARNAAWLRRSLPRKVDIRLPGKGNSNTRGARSVY